jgi:hypothetical protein
MFSTPSNNTVLEYHNLESIPNDNYWISRYPLINVTKDTIFSKKTATINN